MICILACFDIKNNGEIKKDIGLSPSIWYSQAKVNAVISSLLEL